MMSSEILNEIVALCYLVAYPSQDNTGQFYCCCCFQTCSLPSHDVPSPLPLFSPPHLLPIPYMYLLWLEVIQCTLVHGANHSLFVVVAFIANIYILELASNAHHGYLACIYKDYIPAEKQNKLWFLITVLLHPHLLHVHHKVHPWRLPL